ncbi:MAG: tRNA (adenosine(37)-N6)-dimethylallyltransferase MiaA [Syntrophales bacterium]|nr:tRNA (adenosine(37)-N6)-dimethylallyltransferase MiaA [Syntrophales bacterium]MCK9527593.1 tRNA (adenosine(37)-N6)-dimethylallyltransferase MiaA [Syntrophales bacterium]MDX9922210.1 tRNA (adenosine(37)-N6)-dimethylallyltransferase MiaA [Syntrophales bacterium]
MTETRSAIPVVVVVGPTAAGKTAVAMEICRRFGGEVLSADSMQIYRHMDIGTAKPTGGEQARVPHHLISIIDPDEHFSAALYRERASEAAATLRRRGRVVVLAGGTGLYVDALLGGLIEVPPADPELRAHFRREAEARGREYLYNLLSERDALGASRIHPRDSVRIIRALEVLELTGISIVRHQWKHDFRDGLYDCLKIGLAPEREELYRRINERANDMMDQGLAEEAHRLLQHDYAPSLPSMQAFCYRHVIQSLRGDISSEEALGRLKRDTRNYAKRQIAWFKRDGEIHWFGPDGVEKIMALVSNFLSRTDV